MSCDPSRTADVAAVVMQEGMDVYVYLLCIHTHLILGYIFLWPTMETANKSCLWGGLFLWGVPFRIDIPHYSLLSLYRAGTHLLGHSVYDHHQS